MGREQGMVEFFNVALAYPTLPYSIVLGFSVAYWLLVAGGLVDDGFDAGDFDIGDGGMHGVAAMFSRLGLGGAPVMLVVALLAFFGWSFTYLIHLFLLQGLSAPLRWGLGSAAAVLALVPATPIVAKVLGLIRPLARRLRPVTQQSLLGKVGVVDSPEITAAAGRAAVDDGGAGLLLQVRAVGDARYPRGQRVVLVEYQSPTNTYLVVPEDGASVIPSSLCPEPGDKEIHR